MSSIQHFPRFVWQFSSVVMNDSVWMPQHWNTSNPQIQVWLELKVAVALDGYRWLESRVLSTASRQQGSQLTLRTFLNFD
jgi:hypothetical protein